MQTEGSVASGVDHSCALLSNKTVACWGGNDKCQLAQAALQVSCSATHTCARLLDNTVACWGDNYYGQVGCDAASGCTNETDHVLLPKVVAGLHDVIRIATGYKHSCAVLADHTARCWGNNEDGQLGDGTWDPQTETSSSVHPTPVVVLQKSVLSLSGGGAHTCALLLSHRIACWGGNWYGQTGSGSDAWLVTQPLPVTNLECAPGEGGWN
jgi:alpha-tubulin suppressor-like RCC1 family protein